MHTKLVGPVMYHTGGWIDNSYKFLLYSFMYRAYTWRQGRSGRLSEVRAFQHFNTPSAVIDSRY